MSAYQLLHTLTFDTDVCDESCMSPDGTMILLFPGTKEEYFKLCDTSNWRIATIQMDETLNIIKKHTIAFEKKKKIIENRAAWSLDSSKIAFMNSQGQVVLFHVNTSKWTVMDDNNFKFAQEHRSRESRPGQFKSPNIKIIWNNEDIIVTQGSKTSDSWETLQVYIRVWSVKENKCIRMFEEKNIAWETNGNIYCTSKNIKNGFSRLTNTFNLTTGEELFEFKTTKDIFLCSDGNKYRFEKVLLSNDGTNTLLSDGTVCDTNTGQLQYKCEYEVDIFKTWSPDKTWLVGFTKRHIDYKLREVICFLKKGVVYREIIGEMIDDESDESDTDESNANEDDTENSFILSDDYDELQFAWNKNSAKVAIQCGKVDQKSIQIVDFDTNDKKKKYILSTLLRTEREFNMTTTTTNAIQWCDTKICYGYKLDKDEKKFNNIYIWVKKHVSQSRSPSMVRDLDAIMQDELEKIKIKYAHQFLREETKELVRRARGRPPDALNPNDLGGPGYPLQKQEAFDREFYRKRSRSQSLSQSQSRSQSQSKSRSQSRAQSRAQSQSQSQPQSQSQSQSKSKSQSKSRSQSQSQSQSRKKRKQSK